MKQELKKEDYKVVKNNDLVNEKPKDPYTLNQLKLICHLISHIKPTDTNFETKEVLLSELGFDSIDSYNYSRFKNESEAPSFTSRNKTDVKEYIITEAYAKQKLNKSKLSKLKVA